MAKENSSSIILVAGTRPEGIKMIPVYYALKKLNLPVLFCATSQHAQMLAEVFSLFQIKPDIDFHIMKERQDLFHITTQVMHACQQLFQTYKPCLVLVQGDTTSAFAAGLSAFYMHIPVGHIEAGLRTSHIQIPFPEEFNRRTLDMVSSLHFTPTYLATAQLIAQGIDQKTIFQVGNTVVDALHMMKYKILNNHVHVNADLKKIVIQAQLNHKKIMLCTVHRRESLENNHIKEILQAIKDVAKMHNELIIVYPKHPNPIIQEIMHELAFHEISNIIITSPLPYADFVYLLLHADAVATDSGGVSEEAMSLGKKVFIMRDETERIEGVWAGFAELVGTRYSVLVEKLSNMITSSDYDAPRENTLFGDGHASESIAHIVQEYLK